MSDFTPKNGDYASLIEKINNASLENLRNEVIESQAEHEKHAGKLMSEDAEKHLEENNFEKEPRSGISDLTKSLISKTKKKSTVSSQSAVSSGRTSVNQNEPLNQSKSFEENTSPQSIRINGRKKSEPKGFFIFIIFALIVATVAFTSEFFEDSDFAPIFPLMFFIIAAVLISKPWRKNSQNLNNKNK